VISNLALEALVKAVGCIKLYQNTSSLYAWLLRFEQWFTFTRLILLVHW